MKNTPGYNMVPLGFNRIAVIASATVSKEKNTIHCITEADITVPRRLINEHFKSTGKKLSMTAYVVKCLADTIVNHPNLNSFIKGRNLVILNDVTVSVMIERNLLGEKDPELLAIHAAQHKSYLQINDELRSAVKDNIGKLGSMEGMSWIRFIPGFLLKTFIRIADKNIKMAEKYGKVAVTAVGMFNKESAWFIPHGTATVLITIGGINKKKELSTEGIAEREYLCITASFDHNIVDGAPAARFMKQFIETIKEGKSLHV
jgi:pyruvate/2-oxoglutarate dehydrogenase complex dihydrolipoamide acyltransferase (E2) component